MAFSFEIHLHLKMNCLPPSVIPTPQGFLSFLSLQTLLQFSTEMKGLQIETDAPRQYNAVVIYAFRFSILLGLAIY